MATFENPAPREGINTSQEHPLKEFFQLLFGVGAIVLIVVLVVNTFAGSIARQIPMEFERRMVSDLEFTDDSDPRKQARLQALADRLSAHMDLPADMAIIVHYSEADVVNAFATLGGNVVFFAGLLEKLETEEELAAVMAHEIAHIRHRHPISALGKGVMLATLAAFAGGASGSTAGEWLIGSSSNLSMMKFSRDQERQADETAARALQRVYGHIKGADQLFQRFAGLEEQAGISGKRYKVVELFRSHPWSEQRWSVLQAAAAKHSWQIDGDTTPLQWD